MISGVSISTCRRLYEHVDDFDVLEIAEVGNPHFERRRGGRPLVAGIAHDANSVGAASRNRPRQARHVGERLGEERRETHGRGAVDHAVIVGQARTAASGAARNRLPCRPASCRARHAEDRDFRRVDDRREGRAADAAETRHREAATLHFGRGEFAGAGLLAQRREFAREFVDVLPVRIAGSPARPDPSAYRPRSRGARTS